MSAPAPTPLCPAIKETGPAWPSVASPVATLIAPDCPPRALPLSRVMLPLPPAPAAPTYEPAFAVLTTTLPLLLAVLAPIVRRRCWACSAPSKSMVNFCLLTSYMSAILKSLEGYDTLCTTRTYSGNFWYTSWAIKPRTGADTPGSPSPRSRTRCHSGVYMYSCTSSSCKRCSSPSVSAAATSCLIRWSEGCKTSAISIGTCEMIRSR